MADLTFTEPAAVRSRDPRPPHLGLRLEQHRGELIAYCVRMLGSALEAEDAVQETLMRAWRGFDRFEGRASLRSWLYRIAGNVCVDMQRRPQRRAQPMDLASTADAEPRGGTGDGGRGVGGAEARWPPRAARDPVPEDGDPGEAAVARESVRLALMAALQHLPPRQRAVLILREVLRWKATEIAELLGTTVASVNSALQRARSTMTSLDRAPDDPADPLDDTQRGLLTRYVGAFERYDVESLVSLLHPA